MASFKIAALRSRSVLVTGASGFIGSHLCRSLHRSGAIVSGCSRRERDPSDGDPRWPRWLTADLRDPEACRRVIRHSRADTVFHLAGQVTGTRCLSNLYDIFSANLASTVYLLEAAREAGVRRFVLAGSVDEPIGTAPPCSPYAASKAAAAHFVRLYAADGGLEVVHARLAMCYGPAQPDETKLVPYVIGELLAGRVPRLSSGVRAVDWLYVDDVVEGLIAAAVAPGISGLSLDIASGRHVTVREVVETLVGLHGQGDIEPQFGAVPDRRDEAPHVTDVDTAHERLGWRARTTLPEGLASTYRWYAQRPRVGVAISLMRERTLGRSSADGGIESGPPLPASLYAANSNGA